MINLDRQKITITCPRCGFLNDVTMQQVRTRDVIICRGCKSNVQLLDHMNTTRKAIRSVRRSLQRLQETLNQTRKITIRF